jgi:hypothetical protein
MRRPMAQAIEMGHAGAPRRLEVLCGKEVDFLPEIWQRNSFEDLNFREKKKRPRQGGRDGEVFFRAHRLGLLRYQVRKDPMPSRLCFSLTTFLQTCL